MDKRPKVRIPLEMDKMEMDKRPKVRVSSREEEAGRIEYMLKLIGEYNQLKGGDFIHNIDKLTEIALKIFLEIAKRYNLPINTVSLKPSEISLEQAEQVKEFSKLLKESVVISEFGEVRVEKATEGTVVFVDITRSMDYFKDKKNYAGFVIFNSYILLVKTITELTGGEFLEHTGDGALIFYKGKDWTKEFNKENPIVLCFHVGRKLQEIAKDGKIIDYVKIIKEEKDKKYEESPSLVHIGASYGEVVEFYLGNIKKLVSSTVWEAANNCKNAPRYFKYNQNTKKYEFLPMKPRPKNPIEV